MKLAAVAALVACVAVSGCEPAAAPLESGSVQPSLAAPAVNLLSNGGFENGSGGWRIAARGSRAVVTENGRDGGKVLSVRAARGSRMTAESDLENTELPAGEQLEAVVWVSSDRPAQPFELVVEEYVGDDRVSRVAQLHTAVDEGWHPISTTVLTEHAESRLVFRVAAEQLSPGTRVQIDDADLEHVRDPSVRLGASPERLSNGCAVSPRGLPVCSAYLGGAYRLNADPAPWEDALGRTIGVRRTYYEWDQVEYAVRVAREDLANRRLPWVSFKLPHSWSEMARGAGDEWARSLALRFASLPGPVWLAFHHEPEGDGEISEWTAMQERLAPIVRGAAPNVGYTLILTGWNQLYGNSEYHLDELWPQKTTIDLVGFDIYNLHGVNKEGRAYGRSTQMRSFFEPLSSWAASRGVAWGLAETGYTAQAAQQDPGWLQRTYQELVAEGGVVFSYFNSNANSIATWSLGTPLKSRQFRTVARGTPLL